MKYKILLQAGIDKVRPFLLERRAFPDLKAFEAVVGSGELLEDGVLRGLAVQLRRIQAEVQKAKLDAEELDRRCFPLVHAALRNTPDVACDPAFWTRFAIVELAPILYERFRAKRSDNNRDGKMNLDNFGIGSRGECWPYKLWVRGELAYDENDTTDPYALGRFGSVDLWTSHFHRQRVMSIRHVFRSVMRFQYPTELGGRPRLHEGQEKKDKLGVRTLVKRLRENWASVEYGYLNDADASALVRFHSKGLHAPDGKPIL